MTIATSWYAIIMLGIARDKRRSEDFVKVSAPLKSKAPGGFTMTELDVVDPLG